MKSNTYHGSNKTIDDIIEENYLMEKELFKIALKNYEEDLKISDTTESGQMFMKVGVIFIVVMSLVFVLYKIYA